MSFVKLMKDDPKFRVEVCAVTVGILVLIVYAFQLRAMLASNKLTRDNFVRDERPYVWILTKGSPESRFPDNALIYVDATGQLSQNFQVKNYGKSPALRVSIQSKITIGVDAIKEMRAYEFPKGSLNGAPLAPGDVVFSTASYDGALGGQTYESLRKIDAGIVVFGRIDYMGLYSNPSDTVYSSDFCFYYLKSTSPSDGIAKGCSERNGIN